MSDRSHCGAVLILADFLLRVLCLEGPSMTILDDLGYFHGAVLEVHDK